MEAIIYKLLWAILPSLLVGITMYFFQKRDKNRDKKIDSMLTRQVKEDLLRVDILFANCNLIKETAIAGKRGVWNGEVEKAMKKQEQAIADYNKFMNELHQEVLNQKEMR